MAVDEKKSRSFVSIVAVKVQGVTEPPELLNMRIHMHIIRCHLRAPRFFEPQGRKGEREEKMSTDVGFSGDETAPFFGFIGASAALVFSCMGAAYGTAKSGVGVASMGVMRPELVMKSIVPVVMAGVLGIYGLIIAVIISTGINPKAKPYYLFDGYAHLSSGLACGLAGLSAGMAIGIVGDAGVRANAQQPKLFVGMILILIFAEALALYGLIVGIILSSRAGQSRGE
ncbi:hypothetical protein AXG93_2912s1220 [Marchantia polymorpha subsp. ruderalis]|uniref:V-type proton ATPase proteolipid subunit n=3 Tax=Marchantia polymorpha TaxID=3197 RepID=A0A176WHP4_MARPO|nr:hypothetical protein AXG93_2912s1220 [Marchantia polymorpha subsp. ruderalis]